MIGFSKWLYLRYFVALTFSLIVLIGFSKWLYLRKPKFELSGIWIFCHFCRLLDSSQNRPNFQKKTRTYYIGCDLDRCNRTHITTVFAITDVIAIQTLFSFRSRLTAVTVTEVVCCRYYIGSLDRCNMWNTYYNGYYYIGL